jgi:hypothetical protein
LGFVSTALLLLEHGAPVHLRNECGDLPIDVAEKAGHFSIVAMLQHAATQAQDFAATVLQDFARERVINIATPLGKTGEITASRAVTYEFLQFMPLHQICEFTTLCKLNSLLPKDGFFWEFMCTRLCHEARLYMPTDLYDLNAVQKWKSLFSDLWRRRDMWVQRALSSSTRSTKQQTRFSIGVCARFRPSVATAGGHARNEEVVLPMYQRAQVIQANTNCKKTEAMKSVMAERWRAAGHTHEFNHGDPWHQADCASVVNHEPTATPDANDPTTGLDFMKAMAKVGGAGAMKDTISTIKSAVGTTKLDDQHTLDAAVALNALKALVAQKLEPGDGNEKQKTADDTEKWKFGTSPHAAFGRTFEDVLQAFVRWATQDPAEDEDVNGGEPPTINISKAFRRLEVYADWMHSTGTQLTEPPLSAESVKAAWKVWKMRTSIDASGRFVWWFDMGKLDMAQVKACPVVDTVRVMVWCTHAILFNENAQKHGMVYVEDVAQVGFWQSMTMLPPKVGQKLDQLAVGVIPVKLALVLTLTDRTTPTWVKLMVNITTKLAPNMSIRCHDFGAVATHLGGNRYVVEGFGNGTGTLKGDLVGDEWFPELLEEQAAAALTVAAGAEAEAESAAPSDAAVADSSVAENFEVADPASRASPTSPGMQHGAAMQTSILAVLPLESKVLTVSPGPGFREFTFDTVLDEDCAQLHAYKPTRRLVADVLNGFDATVLMYGQTGSGKTYTMFGAQTGVLPTDSRISEDSGIVHRACAEILEAIEQRRSDHDIEATLRVSYVEVYGDDVNDLLGAGRPLPSARRRVLEGQYGKEVGNLAEVNQLLSIGEAQKRVSATAMNERSSRAHSLFILSLDQQHQTLASRASASHRHINGMPQRQGRHSRIDGRTMHRSTLILADLGGSEQLRRSKADAGITKMAGRSDKEGAPYSVIRIQTADGTVRSARVFGEQSNSNTRDSNVVPESHQNAQHNVSSENQETQQTEDSKPCDKQSTGLSKAGVTKSGDGEAKWEEYYHQRKGLLETQNINEGLFALKNCITALHTQQRHYSKHNAAKVYVPFSDSRLTQLLSAGLGGNSKTVVMVCCSKENQNAAETIQALRFGEDCNQVKNTATGSTAVLVGMLNKIAGEIEQCEEKIRAKERWEEERVERRNELDGSIEVVTTSVMTGAEEERRQLMELIRRRRELLGEDTADSDAGHEWAQRITNPTRNITRDASTYHIDQLQGSTMQI